MSIFHSLGSACVDFGVCLAAGESSVKWELTLTLRVELFKLTEDLIRVQDSLFRMTCSVHSVEKLTKNLKN